MNGRYNFLPYVIHFCKPLKYFSCWQGISIFSREAKKKINCIYKTYKIGILKKRSRAETAILCHLHRNKHKYKREKLASEVK